ncbi:hypothetical protein FAES_3949 [Fibrella aestuarina BUZ 2]|uniref:AntA/AntB antirepressor domain-containing protein n=1 Tax=Fibrella aestuarina BUZ 2 TaxID=1166018 RepID=I0KCU9_9BACT|nr:antA/AntB antirepressor family protein [Fibrella aestuarina]CCH01952.1 hypothetical protein FAES_3949 [Fibrella aestuarina BUZ 2]
MEALIQITTNAQGASVVSARELHAFLSVKSKFADWFKNRVDKYELVEGQDYVRVSKILDTLGGAQESVDYALTLDCAKELAMVQNNQQGKRARLYFIEAEKQLRQVATTPSLPSATEQLLIQLVQQQTQVSQQQAAISQHQQEQLTQLRADVAALMNGQSKHRRRSSGYPPPSVPALFGTPRQPPYNHPRQLRGAITQIVEQYSVRVNCDTSETYRYLYRQMMPTYGIDVYHLHKQAGQSYLEAIEQYGLLEKLYSIAYATLARLDF